MTQASLAVMIDWDGTDHSGHYEIYPANEESEPGFDYCPIFSYDTSGGAEYETRDEAREAAETEALRMASRIGGQWFTNE